MVLKKKDKVLLPEPVKSVTLTKELQSMGNGTLPATVLSTLRNGGTLYAPAAKAYNRMVVAAMEERVILKPVSSGYRSLEQQEALFFERYSKRPTTRIPRVTRIYKDKTWYLKRGMSPSATPGKSNHGWGLAQDINVTDPKVFAWLCNNAPKFGFYLQGHKYLPTGKPNPEYEAWHWQYCDL